MRGSPAGGSQPPAWPWFALATLVFGTSYALLPLYSSNQNHHFLIGLARAGEGWLRDDWIVTTAAPFPLFTAYVAFVHRYLTGSVHYAIYYLLLGAYAYGLMRIAEHVGPDRSRAGRLAFLAVICVLHNGAVGYLLGVDLPRMPWWQITHWGVAEQEMFGHGAFQASSFGLLLPLAVAWFLDRRPLAATALMAAVLLVHFGYAITAGALTLAFVALEVRRTRRFMRGLAILAIALACAAPAAVYVLLEFGPTSREISTMAANILVNHIPQETQPLRWLGAKTYLQLGLILAGLVCASGTDLLPILLAPLMVGVALTTAQIASGSPELALLFPWRVSALLVPISTALLVRFALATVLQGTAAPHARTTRLVTSAAILVLFTSSLLGAARMTLHFAYFYDWKPATSAIDRLVPSRLRTEFASAVRPDMLPMMRFARSAASEGDLFVIPPELERFRIAAGVPVLADLKSHPYKDLEVLEWRRRLDTVRALYDSGGNCGLVSSIAAQYPVTHIVADARIRSMSCPGWSSVYEDELFTVFRLARTLNARAGFTGDTLLTAR